MPKSNVITKNNSMKPDSSNKSFGIFFSIILFLYFAYSMYKEKNIQTIPIIIVSILMFITIFLPQLLALPNYIWKTFGKMMKSLTNPIILVIIYYLIITPIGLFVRKILCKNFLEIHKNSYIKSYWVARDIQHHNPESLKRLY